MWINLSMVKGAREIKPKESRVKKCKRGMKEA